jgi:hypothetical protein
MFIFIPRILLQRLKNEEGAAILKRSVKEKGQSLKKI